MPRVDKHRLPRRKTAGIQNEEVSTAEEAIPVPWCAGEQQFAVHWISRVYNHFKRETTGRPGKK